MTLGPENIPRATPDVSVTVVEGTIEYTGLKFSTLVQNALVFIGTIHESEPL